MPKTRQKERKKGSFIPCWGWDPGGGGLWGWGGLWGTGDRGAGGLAGGRSGAPERLSPSLPLLSGWWTGKYMFRWHYALTSVQVKLSFY